MARYLCDTNILSELTRPRPNPGVLDWARSVYFRFTPETVSACTAVTN
jgi:predicted nucleic acid-binding protein